MKGFFTNMGMKAEVLEKILRDAKEAKPIKDIGPNTYSVSDYNKVRGRDIATSNLNNNSSNFYDIELMPGDVEFDSQGRLKHIGRSMPKMIDERLFTANKYKLYTFEEDETLSDDEDNKKHSKKADNKKPPVLKVVLGNTIVRAIEQTNELPPQVKAFCFVRDESANWKYTGAELVRSEEVRTFTRSLNPTAVYKLLQEIELRTATSAAEVSQGDSLDDLQ